MPFASQLHLVMMSKYSKFDGDIFNTFWVMGYIKVFAWQGQQQQQTEKLKIWKNFATEINDEVMNEINKVCKLTFFTV